MSTLAEALARLEPWARARGAARKLPEWAARAADPAEALARLEELLAAGLEPRSDRIEPLLAVLGASRALTRALFRLAGGLPEVEKLLATARVSPGDHVSEVLSEAGERLEASRVPLLLRRHRSKHILRIGARDLLGAARVTETMRELSALAEGAIEVACRHARARVAADYGGFTADDRLRFAVLAMGKLGGGELNFSSDIDLVYLFEGGRRGSVGGPRGHLDAQGYAARIAELLTRVLSERTEEGFVFRVDLRLRPDGQSGPIANSLAGALTYYESWGQGWERAAMLKARPVAGDVDLGDSFLGEMRPFVYRRYLDFEAIEEIQAMKRRVDSAHSSERLERDVKLGPGGIREIEFIVQVQQLVHGGRDERVRTVSTLAALDSLASEGLMDPEETQSLARAYEFLRDVEHKLQIVDERQTHLLPAEPGELRLLARRLGFHRDGRAGEEVSRLQAELAGRRARVRRSFEQLFVGEESRPPEGEDVCSLLESHEGRSVVRGRLASMGFRDPEAAAADLMALWEGTPSSRASPRRRRVLRALAPTLFAEIRQASDPDLALRNMASFIGAVGARTSFLALLREKPATLRLLVGLFGSSQYLSNFFVGHPELLDSLVRADLAAVAKDRPRVERELASLFDGASDFESQLDALRRFRNEEFLRIGVNDLQGLLPLDQVREQLSDLAEACLGAAIGVAERALRERFGPAPGRFAVVGMGKLGGRELTYNSDLDLIFVYDASDASGPISVHEYYTKLAQRLMTALQLTTREGVVYRIDTRLRPSGSSGPLVSSLAAFREYHRASSRLWERQALIRARGVAGDPALVREVESIIAGFVYGRTIEAAGVAEIARLRARMERELAGERPGRWNVKTGRGGTVDIEFVAQMLQLRHGRDHPQVRERATDRALESLYRTGLLSQSDFTTLSEGLRFLRHLESRLRIERDQPVEALEHQGPAVEALARRLGYSGSAVAAALLRDLERVREGVRRVYRGYFPDSD